MADRTVRVAVPLAVLAIVIAVFVGERIRIDHELQLVVPPAIAPGATLPARALLFEGIEDPAGPRFASAPVELRLLDSRGRVRARAELAPSPIGGADGTLEVPADLAGRLVVHAIARVAGEPVASVRTPIEVTRDPPEAPLLGRMAMPLQHFELGAIEGSAPPEPFAVRVVGGACVPEQPCGLVVHVGEPAASIRVAPSASVTPGAPSTEGETSGLVRLPVVVHGPEARAELLASRAGVEVGRRWLQVPVALATPALAPGPRIFAQGQAVTLDVRTLGEPRAVVADVYRGGLWSRTASFAPARPGSIGALPPGLWRVQVHADPFSAERSLVRTLLVRDRGESARAAVDRALAGRDRVPPGAPELRLAWATARSEDRLYALPEGVSGRAADEARVEARRSTLRIAALLALVLGLVIAAVVFLRRGVGAALEAQRIMDATGDPALSSVSHRRRTLLSALLLVATLLFALLGAATLIVARARLLD